MKDRGEISMGIKERRMNTKKKIEVWEVEKNRKYQGVRYSTNFCYEP
jgi:hypothetical protein